MLVIITFRCYLLNMYVDSSVNPFLQAYSIERIDDFLSNILLSLVDYWLQKDNKY